MPVPRQQLPTTPTEDDQRKRSKFRKDLKIAFISLSVITVILLALGIYLVADPGRKIIGLRVFGVVLIVLGFICLVIAVVSGNLMFRLISAYSQSKVYQPKAADALRDKPYPRQNDGETRRRNVPVIVTSAESHRAPPAAQMESHSDIDSSVNSQRQRRTVPEPPTVPTAPDPRLVESSGEMPPGGSRRPAPQPDEDQFEKRYPPAPDLQMPPPPFNPQPPPNYAPPSYDEATKM